MKKEVDSGNGIIYRTKDLNEKGISNYVISKMIDQGSLVKVCHGIYAVDDIKELHVTDINVMVENGVISLMSAAMYYKLIDGSVTRCTLTLDRDQKPPKIPYDIFAYIYTTSGLYGIGLNVIDCQGRKIKIYDVERTVCDILKHRNKYDKKVVNQIFINYLKRPDKDIEKLIDYSKQLRIYNVVKQYLEILGEFYE